MSDRLLPMLQCPSCRESITSSGDDALRCPACDRRYPIVNGIPRFVPPENYASNFGLQWNAFRRTQLDSHSGTHISRDRFLKQTGWREHDLRGKTVLDVGCGAGRFAEIALSLGAHVVALDYSSAVEATRDNLGANPKLDVVQASLYELPFKPDSFDYVYCFGVLQHTPNVRGAFEALRRPLKTGGRIAVDVYPNRFRSRLRTKHLVRPITKRMPSSTLFSMTQRWVPRLLPVSLALGRVPRIGRWLRHLVPISNYEGLYPLNSQQIHEWAILDTFDMLAPRYDSPQTERTLRAWFTAQGYRDVEIFFVEQLVGRGVK